MATTSARVSESGRTPRRTEESCQAVELKELKGLGAEPEDPKFASAWEVAQLKALAEANRKAAEARTASLGDVVNSIRVRGARSRRRTKESQVAEVWNFFEGLGAEPEDLEAEPSSERAQWRARAEADQEAVDVRAATLEEMVASQQQEMDRLRGEREKWRLMIPDLEEPAATRAEDTDEHSTTADPAELWSTDSVGAGQPRQGRPPLRPICECGGPASPTHAPAPVATEVVLPLGDPLDSSFSQAHNVEHSVTAISTQPLLLPPNLRMMTDAICECGGTAEQAEPAPAPAPVSAKVVVPLGSTLDSSASKAEGKPRGLFSRLFGCVCRRRAGRRQLQYFDSDGRTHMLEVKDGKLWHRTEDGSVSRVSRLSIKRRASGAEIREDTLGIATLSDDQLRNMEILIKAGTCILDEAPKGGGQVAPSAAAVVGGGAAWGRENSAPSEGASKSQSTWAEDPYSKGVCQELFTLLLGNRDSTSGPQLVEEHVFKVAWRSLTRNGSPGASLRAPDSEVRGAISKEMWTTQLESRFATVDKNKFLELCRQCVADVRTELPDDVSRKSPWFDLDFSTLGRCANRIVEVEHRAITIRQLQRLEAFIQSQTDQAGVLKGWWDRTERTPVVHKPKLNLYQLADWVINPATAPYQCSFVELLTTECKQPAKWFISHWWGEPVVNFIACLENHSRIRSLPETSTYWVCAYANNQHELGRDLAEDPLQSSFARALRMADGVLLILDDQATPFTRVWCCFEEAVTVLQLGSRQNQKLRDIATIADGSPQLLTEGLTEEETKIQETHQRALWKPTGWSKKSKREATFPVAIIWKGLAADIAKAKATEEIDKTRILNCIAGRPEQELNEPPDAHHHKYDAVNRALAGFFAAAALRSAIAAGKDISGEGEICAEDISDSKALPLLRSLREDRQRHALVLYLSGMERFRDADLTALCRNLPQQLVTLSLDCSKCNGLTTLADLWPGLSSLWALTRLDLNFADCSGLTSLGDLGRNLFGLRVLRVLTLNFGDCSGLTSAGDLGQGLSCLRSLTALTLVLRKCSLASLGDLGQGLAGLRALTALELNLAHLRLASLGDLGQGLAGLRALTWLRLSLRGCSGLASLGDLGQYLAGLRALATLRLSLAHCSGLASVAGLGPGLAGLPVLADVCLSLDGCSSLGSLGGLARDLAALPALAALELTCSGLPGAAVEGLRQDRAALESRGVRLVFPLPGD